MFFPATVKGNVAPWKKLPVGAITTEVGMAMYLSGGKLVKATGTTAPEYICMERHKEAVADGTYIHVLPVSPGIEFETQASAALTSVKVGDKVTIATDALRITATTTDGVARVLAMEGTEVGATVRVVFE
ncbi:MAG: hypothetical protein IJ017_04555 [Oscillospiraceae bacterium]|nr:hypothetical protein [Oscillospiraceae bacterium]